MSTNKFDCCPPSFPLDSCRNEINPDEFIKSIEIQFKDVEGFKAWYSLFDRHLLFAAQRQKLTVTIQDGILTIQTDSISKDFSVYVLPNRLSGRV